MKEKLTLNWTHILITDSSSQPQKKNQPTQVKSCFLAPFIVLWSPKKFPPPISILREKPIFLMSTIWWSDFKIDYKRYTMSLLYTFRELDPKTCESYRILGFRIFFAFRRTQNSNPGGHKTRICIDKVPFTLLPWIRLMGNTCRNGNMTFFHDKMCKSWL